MYARPLLTMILSVALGAILTAVGLLGWFSVPVAGFTASAGLLLAIYGVLQYADHRNAVKLVRQIEGRKDAGQRGSDRASVRGDRAGQD